MRALIIEDDRAAAHALRRRLWREGHVVDVASNSEAGATLTEAGGYDAVILAATLPDIDGAAVTRRVRDAGCATPILMLATRATLDECLRGLDAGADDYLTRPFAFAELAARLRALARHGEQPVREDRLAIGDLVLDRRTRLVTRGDHTLALAPKEFALLEYLLRHPGQVLTRAMLLDHVWDYGFEPSANAVDAAIKRLRKAVDAGEAQYCTGRGLQDSGRNMRLRRAARHSDVQPYNQLPCRS